MQMFAVSEDTCCIRKTENGIVSPASERKPGDGIVYYALPVRKRPSETEFLGEIDGEEQAHTVLMAPRAAKRWGCLLNTVC